MPGPQPNVPYGQGVPTVPAEVKQPDDYIHAPATPQDFGASIGQAAQGAGQQTEQTAKQGMDLAINLASMHNEATATQAYLDASKQVGDVEDWYHQQRGTDAGAAMPEAGRRLDAVYQNARAALPNAATQQMFDARFAREVAYAQKGFGLFAADQTERANQVSKVNYMADQANRMATALDWSEVTSRINEIGNTSLALAHANGLGKDDATSQTTHYVSEGIVGLVRAHLAREDINGARSVIDAADKGTVPGTDIPMLDAAHRGPILAEVDNKEMMFKRSAEVDEMRRQRLADKAERQNQDAAEDTVIRDIFSDKPTMTAQSISNNDTLRPAQKLTMIGVLDRLNKPDPASVVSRDTTASLLTDMRRDDTDPKRITDLSPVYDAFQDGKLSRADFGFLKQEFTDMRTPEGERLGQMRGDFLRAVAPMVDKSNPLMGKLDPDGRLQMYRMEQDISTKIAEYRKGGKSPYDLFNPAKPDFLGTPAALAPYQKSLDQSMRDVSARLRAGAGGGAGVSAAPARKPGESPDDYLKRIGG